MAEGSTHKGTQKEEGLLFDVARTIGATLGTVAGKVSSQTKRARKSSASRGKKRTSRASAAPRKRARAGAGSKRTRARSGSKR